MVPMIVGLVLSIIGVLALIRLFSGYENPNVIASSILLMFGTYVLGFGVYLICTTAPEALAVFNYLSVPP